MSSIDPRTQLEGREGSSTPEPKEKPARGATAKPLLKEVLLNNMKRTTAGTKVKPAPAPDRQPHGRTLERQQPLEKEDLPPRSHRYHYPTKGQEDFRYRYPTYYPKQRISEDHPAEYD